MKNKQMGVCFISSFKPRQCGIATFTANIFNELPVPKNKKKIVAISDKPNFYKYGPQIIAEIIQDNKISYIKAARKINNDKDIDIVCLQHVFSLFGGKHGDNIVLLLKNLKKPVVTTFHMIYSKTKKPNTFEVVDSSFSFITKEIIKYSKKLIVIIQPIADLLENQYDVPEEKIYVIPHGMPNLKRAKPEIYKKKLGLGKGEIISTFGLIRPKKGLEYVIRSMPKVLKKYPYAKFIILGETHPNRPKKYYNFLIKEAKKYHLYNKHVFFINQYLTFKEIVHYLLATDVFITPYLVPEQNSSGAIAYAMGCGKAIISTPFAYAKEALAEKRGLFANYADSNSVYKAIDFFFTYPEKRKCMERLAYQYAQKHSFKSIAEKYYKVFMQVL
jgi:glycosyltransferase involved in cell wall biosynthesis